MGMLTRFDLRKIKEVFDISHLIETGAWYGDGIKYALDYDYSIESCEINDKFYMIVKDRFETRDVRIFHGGSIKFLQTASDIPALYWLDAHLPGLYLHHSSKQIFSQSENLPLEYELTVLATKEHLKDSILIIDDLRIYLKGRGIVYEDGQVLEGSKQNFDPIKWFDKNLSETHTLEISYTDTGYLVAYPNKHGRVSLGKMAALT